VPAGGYDVVRDPLWNNIGIDHQALAVLDTEPFQRLRYVRQLGHAFLVYPGATHTRFEHALGTYHLARRALTVLAERGQLDAVPPDELTLTRLAALLHDIGHYPFSHALEEAGLASHETLARRHLDHPQLAAVLDQVGIPDITTRLTDLISGRGSSGLRGLISGALDLDKIDYLTRDARMSGVPYGTVDVDRLLHAFTLIGEGSERTVGIHEKGVSALESLLFAKYQMYRNVYWHHAVRSATTMFKRLVRSSIAQGMIDVDWIAESTDEALMERLRSLPDPGLAERLRARRLYKRVLDVPASDLPLDAGRWVAEVPDLVEQVEDRLAEESGLERGELLLDFPAKPAMLAGDIQVLRRDHSVAPARLEILKVADELHAAARRLRIYAARPVPVQASRIIALVELAPDDITRVVAREHALLS